VRLELGGKTFNYCGVEIYGPIVELANARRVGGASAQGNLHYVHANIITSLKVVSGRQRKYQEKVHACVRACVRACVYVCVCACARVCARMVAYARVCRCVIVYRGKAATTSEVHAITCELDTTTRVLYT